MSQKINQAVNQVRFTNVAVVKLKKNGKRFEIACYRNKVENWRSGLETDLEEVLQIDRVFSNVGKGVVAKKKDLLEAFGTDDQEAICKIILEKGSSQVSDRERQMQYESKFRNIATIVSEKCINPTTMRPYPVSTIENAMKNTIHYAVVPNRGAKQQALEVIRELSKHIPLKRAQMLIRLTVTSTQETQLDAKLEQINCKTTRSETSSAGQLVRQLLIDPSDYRTLLEFTAALTPPGTLEVKEFSVQEEDEADVEVTAESSEIHSIEATKQTTQQGGQDASDRKQKNFDEEEDLERDAREPAGDVDVYTSQVLAQKQLQKNKKKKKKEQRRAMRAAQDNDEEQEQRETPSQPAETPQPVQESESPPKPPAIVEDLENMTLGSRGVQQPSTSGGLKCLTCGASFGNDRNLQREHYRSDLHRLNLKLKMKNLPCMTEEEFSLLEPQERDAILHDYS